MWFKDIFEIDVKWKLRNTCIFKKVDVGNSNNCAWVFERRRDILKNDLENVWRKREEIRVSGYVVGMGSLDFRLVFATTFHRNSWLTMSIISSCKIY